MYFFRRTGSLYAREKLKKLGKATDKQILPSLIIQMDAETGIDLDFISQAREEMQQQHLPDILLLKVMTALNLTSMTPETYAYYVRDFEFMWAYESMKGLMINKCPLGGSSQIVINVNSLDRAFSPLAEWFIQSNCGPDDHAILSGTAYSGGRIAFAEKTTVAQAARFRETAFDGSRTIEKEAGYITKYNPELFLLIHALTSDECWRDVNSSMPKTEFVAKAKGIYGALKIHSFTLADFLNCIKNWEIMPYIKISALGGFATIEALDKLCPPLTPEELGLAYFNFLCRYIGKKNEPEIQAMEKELTRTLTAESRRVADFRNRLGLALNKLREADFDLDKLETGHIKDFWQAHSWFLDEQRGGFADLRQFPDSEAIIKAVSEKWPDMVEMTPIRASIAYLRAIEKILRQVRNGSSEFPSLEYLVSLTLSE